MKKRMIAFLVLITVTVLFVFSAAFADGPGYGRGSVFLLPASLTTIETEAFLGTPVNTVVFREEILHIADYAFENTPGLTDIYISAPMVEIDDHAFPLNERLTLHAAAGSSAQAWADRHEVGFDVFSVWSIRSALEILWALQACLILYGDLGSIPEKKGKACRQLSTAFRSRRPQNRPELNPIDYKFP